MLECLVNFIANCKLSEFAIRFCHSKKMYSVTIFLWSDQCRSKLLLLGYLPNLVGRCPTVICSVVGCSLSYAWLGWGFSSYESPTLVCGTGGKIVVADQIYRGRFLFASKNCENNKNTTLFLVQQQRENKRKLANVNINKR
jgi:hypothetical protein